MALRTPTKDAEDIKQRYGCALRQLADPQDMVEVPGIGERGPRLLSRQTLAEVIEPRIEELYALVQSELRRSGYEDLLSSGIVITGGSSSMRGMVELGEEIFHMPVRIGQPLYHGGLSEVVRNPRYSTAVGLLLLGLQEQRQQMAVVVDEYGGVAGIVTLELLLEEMFGSVTDELGNPAQEFHEIDENTTRVDGGMSIYDGKDELEVELPDGDYETVAGLVLEKLGHIPRQGETVLLNGYRLTVAEVKGVKIESVLITKL
jgi:cell division ATPase FtsA